MFNIKSMWSDGDTFNDTLGIMHDTGCAQLDNKLNVNICFKGGGGGGGTTTTESGVPKEFRPYVTESLKNVQDAYDAGALGHVEGLTPEQKDAYQRKLELGKRGGVLDQVAADSYGAAGAYRDAAAGRGIFGADALGKQTEALESSLAPTLDRLGAQEDFGAAIGGRLGSARADALKGSTLAGAATDAASKELAARRDGSLAGASGVIQSGSNIQNQFGQGASATENVGTALQQQKQNEADATYQALSRVFQFYGSPALGSESKSTSSQSGGGK